MYEMRVTTHEVQNPVASLRAGLEAEQYNVGEYVKIGRVLASQENHLLDRHFVAEILQDRSRTCQQDGAAK